MTRPRIPLAFVLAVAVSLPALAAINPEEFKRVASEVVKVREIARIVARDTENRSARQRVTLVGEVVDTERSTSAAGLRVIVIDYTVDLAAREAEARAYQEERGTRPGRQFMHEPDPPALDAQKEFWAHLAPVAGRLGNVNRYSGRVVNFERGQFSGPVFVPVAGQYSWDTPARRARAESEKKETMTEQTYTGTLKTGIMAIGAETTGIILETASGTYELDVKANPTAAADVDRLHGKTVIVTGEYRPRPGVEVRERRILEVHSLREAP